MAGQNDVFFGRDKERSWLKSKLQDRDTRVIQVLGRRQIGKTKLVTKVLLETQEKFGDTVDIYKASCGNIRELRDWLQEKEFLGSIKSMETCDKQKKTILVIRHMWKLLEGEESLTRLVELLYELFDCQCMGLKIVLLLRQRIQLPRLHPHTSHCWLRGLEKDDAKLLLQRSAGDVDVTAEADEICDLCGWLPHPLVVIGILLRDHPVIVSPQSVLESLRDDVFAAVEMSAQGSVDQVLHEIKQEIAELHEDEQYDLACVGYIPESFSRDGAVAVIGKAGARAQRALLDLYDRGLLEDVVGDRTRMKLPQLLKHAIQNEGPCSSLLRVQDKDGLKMRFTKFYGHLIKQLDRDGSEDLGYRLTVDYESLRKLCQVATSCRSEDMFKEAFEVGREARYLITNHMRGEAVPFYEHLHQCAVDQGKSFYHRGVTLGILANCKMLTGGSDYKETHRQLIQARDLLTPGGPSEELARAWTNLAFNAHRRGAQPEARRYSHEAVEMAKETDSSSQGAVVASALTQRGVVLSYQGEHQPGMVLLREALGINESRKPTHPTTAVSHSLLGLNLYGKGDKVGALREYQQAAFKLRGLPGALKKPDSLAICLYWIGRILTETDVLDEAGPYLNEALEIRRSLQYLHAETATFLRVQGQLFSKQGNHHEAVKNLEEALQVYGKLKTSPVTQGFAEVLLARALLGLGDFEKAWTRMADLVKRREELLKLMKDCTIIADALALLREIFMCADDKFALARCKDRDLQDICGVPAPVLRDAQNIQSVSTWSDSTTWIDTDSQSEFDSKPRTLDEGCQFASAATPTVRGKTGPCKAMLSPTWEGTEEATRSSTSSISSSYPSSSQTNSSSRESLFSSSGTSSSASSSQGWGNTHFKISAFRATVAYYMAQVLKAEYEKLRELYGEKGDDKKVEMFSREIDKLTSYMADHNARSTEQQREGCAAEDQVPL